MDRCPKDEATAKNLVCKEALLDPEKNWKTCWGGGGGVDATPVGHRWIKTKCLLSNL